MLLGSSCREIPYNPIEGDYDLYHKSHRNLMGEEYQKDMLALKKNAHKKLAEWMKHESRWKHTTSKCSDFKAGGDYTLILDNGLKVVFIPCFAYIELDKFDGLQNGYLKSVVPSYRDLDAWFPFLLGYKYVHNKVLCADGYVLDRNNKIIATISSVGGKRYRVEKRYSDQEAEQNARLVKSVLTQNFDYIFTYKHTDREYVWCVKDGNTQVFDINQNRFFTVSQHIDRLFKLKHQEWLEKHRPLTIAGISMRITNCPQKINAKDSIYFTCELSNMSDSIISFTIDIDTVTGKRYLHDGDIFADCIQDQSHYKLPILTKLESVSGSKLSNHRVLVNVGPKDSYKFIVPYTFRYKIWKDRLDIESVNNGIYSLKLRIDLESPKYTHVMSDTVQCWLLPMPGQQ